MSEIDPLAGLQYELKQVVANRQRLKAEIDIRTKTIDDEYNPVIKTLLDMLGVKSTTVDVLDTSWSVTLSKGQRSRLMPLKLLAQGVTEEQIKKATVKGKKYESVTVKDKAKGKSKGKDNGSEDDNDDEE